MNSVTPPPAQPWSGRFPGFDVLDQSGHWDQVTTGVVLERVGMAPDIRFFTPTEQATATALCDQLLAQDDDAGSAAPVPIVNLIDARLAEEQTDGWHYHDMPADGQAWRDTLSSLNDDANERFGIDFAACSTEQQASLIQAVQDCGTNQWHGMSAKRVEPVDPLRMQRLLLPPLGLERNRLLRPGLPPGLPERGRGQAGTV